MALLQWTLLISLFTVTHALDISPQTISDSHNNFADKDSQLTFASVPAGDPYVVDPGTYSYDGLLPLFQGVQGYVNICFYGDDPYSEFVAVVQFNVSCAP